MEIDLKCERSLVYTAGASSLACSAGPVQPVGPGVGSLRLSRQDLFRMPNIGEFVQFKPKLVSLYTSNSSFRFW